MPTTIPRKLGAVTSSARGRRKTGPIKWDLTSSLLVAVCVLLLLGAMFVGMYFRPDQVAQRATASTMQAEVCLDPEYQKVMAAITNMVGNDYKGITAANKFGYTYIAIDRTLLSDQIVAGYVYVLNRYGWQGVSTSNIEVKLKFRYGIWKNPCKD